MQAHVQCFVVHRVLEFFTYSTNCRNMELSQGYGNLPAYIPTQTTFAGDTHVPPYSGDASVPPYSGGTGVPPSQSLIGAAHVAPTPNPTIVHETPYMDDHAGFLQQKKFIQRLYFAINHDQTGAIRWNETGKA